DVVGHRDVPVNDHVGARGAGCNPQEKRSNEQAPERRQDARSPALCPRLRAHRDFVVVGSDGALKDGFVCHVSFRGRRPKRRPYFWFLSSIHMEYTSKNERFFQGRFIGICVPWIEPSPPQAAP